MRDLSSQTSNLCDMIDTRNVLARIEELTDDYFEAELDAVRPVSLWGADDRQELEELTAIVEAVRGYGGDSPEDGITLIRETYFTDYIREFYADGGGPELYREDPEKPYSGPALVSWGDLMAMAPFNHIDWDAVAYDEQTGYSQLEYDRVTYYYL